MTNKTRHKGKVYNSTNWFTVENDSSYQMADTLIFYNNSDLRYQKHYCNFIDWNFYKKNAFWLQRLELCTEPTTASVVKDIDFFTYEVSDDQTPLVIRVFNQQKLIDEFEVLSLSKQILPNGVDKTTDVMTLRRVKMVVTEH